MIRVDSRYRSSGTPTAFSVQLPRTVEFPPETVCYVSAVSLPVAWFNVDTFFSDKLYVRESRDAGVRCRVITLDAGNYTSVTLPVALAEKLNAGKSFPTMAYSVNYIGSRGCLLIQLSANSGQAADSSARFQLPSEDELLSGQAQRIPSMSQISTPSVICCGCRAPAHPPPRSRQAC